MKTPSILLACFLLVMMSCTKSNEYHPELGDGNNEIVTVGASEVCVKYYRSDISELEKIEFQYKPENQPFYQSFDTVEMTKRDTYFELNLTGLLSNTVYTYKYELFFKNGNIDQQGYYSFTTDTIQSTNPFFIGYPTLMTADISEITANSAKCGGEVISMGSAEIINCGVCWSKTPNPTFDGNHTASTADDGNFSITMNELEANTVYYVRAYAVSKVGVGYGEEKCFITHEDNGGDWVDLGLPSGLLWATRNVGANSPEDYGAYFAWGETQPKTTYDWSNYKYGEDSHLTKYCTESNYGLNGFVDHLSTLLPEDDAATANWGNEARTPTYDEWLELYNYCSSTWTTQNGVIGMLFNGTNGNNLFLPAAGYYSGVYLGEGCNRGLYWSSTTHNDNPNCAITFGVSNHCYMVGYGRCEGQSIRPVWSQR